MLRAEELARLAVPRKGDVIPLAPDLCVPAKGGGVHRLTLLCLHGLIAEGLLGIYAELGQAAADAVAAFCTAWPVTRVTRAGKPNAPFDAMVEVPAALLASARDCAALAKGFLAVNDFRLFAGPRRVLDACGDVVGGQDGSADHAIYDTTWVELQCVKPCTKGWLLEKKRKDKWQVVARNIAAVRAAGRKNPVAMRSARSVLLLTIEAHLEDPGIRPALCADVGRIELAPEGTALHVAESWHRVVDPRRPTKVEPAPPNLPKKQQKAEREGKLAEEWLGQIKRFPKASPKLPRDVKLNHYTALRFGANESRTRAADLREFLAGAWGWQDGDTDDSDSDVDLRPTRRAGTGKPYICKRRKLVHAHCREFGLPCSDSD